MKKVFRMTSFYTHFYTHQFYTHYFYTQKHHFYVIEDLNVMQFNMVWCDVAK